MTKPSELSVRGQLALLAVIFALPAAGIIVWSGIGAREEKIREARAQTQKFTTAVAAMHESRLAAAEQLMMALANMPAVKSRDVAVEPMLREIHKLNPTYSNISVADADGNVWASSLSSTGFSIADRRHFKNAMATGRISSGEYVTGRVSAKPAFYFGYPIRDARGENVGVISVGFDLLSYARLLELSRLPPGSSYVFIDHQGTIVARAVDPEPYVGHPLEPELFKAMLDGPEEETSIGAGLGGERRIRTYRKFRLSGENAPYMYLRAGMPFASVIASANRALALSVGLLFSCVAIALVLAWLVAKRTIVDRVGMLESASRRVADGDLAVRVGELIGGGELGQLGRTFDRMAEKLALRDKALQESERSLLQAQKMEAVGRLAGGVAHDFNNILTVILAATEELLDEGSGIDGPTRELVQEVADGAGRASALTHQLLAFSRRQPLCPRVVDVNEVVRRTEKFVRRLIGEDIEITTSLDPALGLVRADPGQIEQVLMNLVVNARDAMPRGGRLAIQTSNVEHTPPDASSRRDDAPTSHVLIAVCDTGAGMEPEVLQRVFEPFFTTKERGRGTGLGLSTVLGIVEQSGGRVVAHSEPGKGATFEVYLPKISGHGEAVSAPEPATRAPLPAGGSERVLVVEDDERVRAFLLRSLRAAGYDVLEAETPAKAERLVREARSGIDLLVSDVVMPEMDGPALADRLVELRPGLRVLFVSGYTDNAALRSGSLPPGRAFLPKPFTQAELMRAARALLDTDTPGHEADVPQASKHPGLVAP